MFNEVAKFSEFSMSYDKVNHNHKGYVIYLFISFFMLKYNELNFF